VPPARNRIVGIVLIAASVICLAVPAAWLPGVRMSVVSLVEPILTLLAGGESRPPMPDDPDELRRELARLRDEHKSVKQKLIETEDRCYRLARQLAKIEEFRKIAPKVIDPATDFVVPARIIGRSTNWQSLTVTINRGAADGVRVGAGVTSGQAVVGIVTEAGSGSARVALLSERGVKVPAAIVIERSLDGGKTVRERRQGLVVGDGSRVMMKYVRSPESIGGAEVLPADRIITSGLTGIFRRGWIVGEVANVGDNPEEPFLTIEVTPEVNFADLESVLVVRTPEKPLAGGAQP